MQLKYKVKRKCMVKYLPVNCQVETVVLSSYTIGGHCFWDNGKAKLMVVYGKKSGRERDCWKLLAERERLWQRGNLYHWSCSNALMVVLVITHLCTQ